jgi:hypothetical protein
MGGVLILINWSIGKVGKQSTAWPMSAIDQVSGGQQYPPHLADGGVMLSPTVPSYCSRLIAIKVNALLPSRPKLLY